jgi:hypothetical protein
MISPASDLSQGVQSRPGSSPIAVGSRGIIIGLVLSSAGSLAFEISLTRIFAIQQFHSFAFVVVSLAVMGTAASGVALSLRTRPPSLARLALASALGMGVCYVTIDVVPFDSYVILWDPRQIVALVLYFLTASLPFFFVGWATGACLAEAGERAYLPYAANLVGAGFGCIAALAAHTVHGPEAGLGAAVGLTSLGAAAFSPARRGRIALVLVGIGAGLLGFRPPAALELRLSPYKPLSTALLSPGAVRTMTLYGAGERLDVVESDAVHVFPGLSLNAASTLPHQVALYADGDGPLPITQLAPDSPEAGDIASHLPGGLAYVLRPAARTLIVEPGGGLEALAALALGARPVSVAFDEPLVLDVLEGRYLAFTQGLVAQPDVRILARSARGALRVGGDFDVIDFALSDPYRPVTAGAYSLSEDYTLTVESVAEAFSRLNNEDGVLIITRWLGTPPSEETRLFATVLAALDKTGVHQPRAQVIAYRGMRTATVMAARRPFSPGELVTIRQFLDENGFDPIVLPDLQPGELNRFNRLPEDTYHDLFDALLTDPGGVEGSYAFDVRPPTDDRPYFFHFFRWSQIPEILQTLGTTWEPFGGSGYLVLIVLLGIMTLFSLPLAIAPRLLLIRNGSSVSPQLSILAYFAALGAGYLLVEIPLIQQLTLLLDRPSIALAVVLFTLLSASGLGSLASTRWDAARAGLWLVVVLLVTLLASPVAIHAALGWPFASRVAIGILLCFPAGFLMGMPFVAGLRSLSRAAPDLVAWAWAINGAASGVSGVVAAMIGLTWGLRAAIAAGMLMYVAAALAGRGILAAAEDRGRGLTA